MNLHYNISFALSSLILVVILLLFVSINYSSTNIVNKRFKAFLVALLAMIVFDIGTAISNDNANLIPKALNILLNSVYFALGALVALLFLYYCISIGMERTNPKVRKIIYLANIITFGVYALTLAFNGFFGFYFYFDDAMVYSHGPVYILVNAFTLIFVFESIAVFVYGRKQFNRRQVVCTILFYASFFLSFALQLFVFPDILLSDLGSAIGALLILFSIATPDYVKLMATLNELHELKASLEIQVDNRTKELDEEKKSYEELTLETLSSLAHVIDAKDHYTNGHSFRVAAYSKGIAEILGFSYQRCEQIYFAGLIHDVGKIGINEAILAKPGKLNDDEFAIIRSHSALGGDILKGIKEFPIFEQVARSHHERYDGLGYPDKLKGEDIPFEARIVTVADTFDAMTSDRSYRKALSDKVALEELEKYKGTQFDPSLVDAFMKLYRSYPDSIRNHIDDLSRDIQKSHEQFK